MCNTNFIFGLYSCIHIWYSSYLYSKLWPLGGASVYTNTRIEFLCIVLQDDLLPKVIQNYRHHPSNEEESPSYVASVESIGSHASVLGHDSSGESAERMPSSSCASACSASTTEAAASMSVRPALFHAVVRMIALVEGGGLVDRDGPEFDIAVADANYGMLINDSRRLVYTRQYGLQLLEFTD